MQRFCPTKSTTPSYWQPGCLLGYKNTFESYVLASYYAAQWSEGVTPEWCFVTNGRNRIIDGTVGGEHTWYMLGQAYFDETLSKYMSTLLDAEHNLPESADKLWEAVLIEHIKEFTIYMRPYHQGVINEFDSLDELRHFDPNFLLNVNSEIFNNIARILKCNKNEIHDVYPLKQGLTNLSCHFATDSGEYVYRHPGVGTELLVDREGEVAALKTSKELGLDNTFIYENSKQGWKISYFIPHAKNLDSKDPTQVARAMQMARSLHQSGTTVKRHFDFYEEAKRYEQMLRKKEALDIPGFEAMAAKVDRLEQYVRADHAPICLCHNDFFGLNFLISESGQYYLID